MAETEQQMIGRLLAPLTRGLEGAYGLTDDAAALAPPPGGQFVISMDTLTAGLHFLFDATPEAAAQAAHKALAVNVSDLAAKGAEPYAYFLSLALPIGFADWLDNFVASLASAQKRWGITLAGGDTVRSDGPLSVTVTALGVVPDGKMIRRSTASANDLLFVSGTIGDAVLGLKLARGDEGTGRWKDCLTSKEQDYLVSRTRTPDPRVPLVPALREFARASLDISDGLALDASRLAEASGLAVEIDAASVPLSPAAAKLLDRGLVEMPDILSGGDDYEILAAVAEANAEAFAKKASDRQVAVTRIGQLGSGSGLTVRDGTKQVIELKKLGWEHLG